MNEDILYSPVENHNEPEKQEPDIGFSIKFVEWDAIVEQISKEMTIETMTITAPSRKLDSSWWVTPELQHFTVIISIDDDLSDEVEEFN